MQRHLEVTRLRELDTLPQLSHGNGVVISLEPITRDNTMSKDVEWNLKAINNGEFKSHLFVEF